ncbi:hypothetical protein [Streptomyces sp. NPDC047042]
MAFHDLDVTGDASVAGAVQRVMPDGRIGRGLTADQDLTPSTLFP